jgi:hypothetical protein
MLRWISQKSKKRVLKFRIELESFVVVAFCFSSSSYCTHRHTEKQATMGKKETDMHASFKKEEREAVEQGRPGTKEWSKYCMTGLGVQHMISVFDGKCTVSGSQGSRLCRVRQHERASLSNCIILQEGVAVANLSFGDGAYTNEVIPRIRKALGGVYTRSYLDCTESIEEILGADPLVVESDSSPLMDEEADEENEEQEECESSGEDTDGPPEKKEEKEKEEENSESESESEVEEEEDEDEFFSDGDEEDEMPMIKFGCTK